MLATVTNNDLSIANLPFERKLVLRSIFDINMLILFDDVYLRQTELKAPLLLLLLIYYVILRLLCNSDDDYQFCPVYRSYWRSRVPMKRGTLSPCNSRWTSLGAPVRAGRGVYAERSFVSQVCHLGWLCSGYCLCVIDRVMSAFDSMTNGCPGGLRPIETCRVNDYAIFSNFATRLKFTWYRLVRWSIRLRSNCD